MTKSLDSSRRRESSLLIKILCGDGTSLAVCDWAPGSKIPSHGEVPDGAYLIESGAIGLRAKDDRNLFVDVLGPDDLLGLPETLGRHPFVCDAVVLQPTKTIFIRHSELTRLLRSDPAAAIQILKALANQTNSLLKETARLKAAQRRSRAAGSQPQSKRGEGLCDRSHKQP